MRKLPAKPTAQCISSQSKSIACSLEEEAKRAKSNKSGKKELRDIHHPAFAFFAPLCFFCFLFQTVPGLSSYFIYIYLH
jgi:hypothetical protein